MLKGLKIRIEAKLANKSTREVGYKERSFQDVINQNYHIMNPEQRLIVDVAKNYCNKEHYFLELGCGAGRNLECLRQHGYNKLYGIDVSREAINVAKHYYPNLAKVAHLRSGYIQEILNEFEDNEFDVVYSVAVLQHILSDTEDIFYEMSRIAKKFIITIESDLYEQEKKNEELGFDPKERVARDYNAIFSSLGFEQIVVFGCWEVPVKLNDISEHFTQDKFDMLEEMRDFIVKNGRCPTAGEADGLFKNNLNVYEEKFGSWLLALEACGIEKPYAGQAYTVRVLQKK